MLAFTFPGQGSQRPGMGRPWVDHESWELVEEASDVAGRDVAKLLLDADADELRDTRNAQLTTFVSSLMVLDAVERLGIEPSFCAGHSLGEYTALTATGALGFDDGVRLVVARADAMHEAGLAQPGTMAAVLGLDDDQVDVACRRADEDVWVANFNAPGQVVIAGSPEGVAAASGHAKELGAKRVMPLQVSGAFHTPFMTAARNRCGRRSPRPTRATPRCRSCRTSTPSPTTRARSGPACSRRSSRPRCAGSSACRSSTTSASPTTPSSAPAACSPGWPSARSPMPARSPSRPPRSSTSSSSGSARNRPTGPGRVEGEHLFASERLVVSPAAGIFARAPGIADGSDIDVGTVLGHVGEREVRSPFAGTLQSYIAVETERVTARQPIAWLRTS